MTTTRRMVYATIANAVLAGLPEPQEMTFDPATVWLKFDSHDEARLWARWHSPECLASHYTSATTDGRALACYYGERADWKWSIVGTDRSLISPSRDVDANERPMSTPEEAMLVTLGRVPCGRCGHDELLHEVEDDGFARCCLDCKGLCVPVVLVPAHVTGWAIEGRAK